MSSLKGDIQDMQGLLPIPDAIISYSENGCHAWPAVGTLGLRGAVHAASALLVMPIRSFEHMDGPFLRINQTDACTARAARDAINEWISKRADKDATCEEWPYDGSEPPAEGTARWLEHELLFKDWYGGESTKHLLWFLGEPGTPFY